MLILSRRQGEKIHINGEEIQIYVKGFRRFHNELQVELGIEAPKHITIDREEIHNRKLKQSGFHLAA